MLFDYGFPDEYDIEIIDDDEIEGPDDAKI